jgi:hypothetical protein
MWTKQSGKREQESGYASSISVLAPLQNKMGEKRQNP